MQIPPIHIQFGNVGADLNAGEIFRRARIASNPASDRRAKHYVSGSCGRAGSHMAANTTAPHATTLLIRPRIGRTPDKRSRLCQERGIRGVDRGNK